MADAVTVAPNLYKVLFENDRVRVLDTRYGPGVTSEMHSHPDVVVVALTEAKGIFTMADGHKVDIEIPAGGSVFVEAQDHAVENVGSFALHAILVELK